MAAPVFDASVLSKLTDKIQSGLKGQGAKAQTKSRDAGKKVDRVKAGAGKPGKQQAPAQGKKRTRDGQEKPQGNGAPSTQQAKKSSFQKARPAAKTSARPTKSSQRPSGRRTGADDGLDLRELVRELGGDDEDLKLIEGANSDSEMEGQEEKHQKGDLKKDLQQMIKELGFAQARPQDAETSSDEDGEAALEAGVQLDEQGDGFSDGEGNSANDGESEDEDVNGSSLIAQAKQALEAMPAKARANANALVIDPQANWHALQLPSMPPSSAENVTLPTQIISTLHEHSKQLLEEENERYSKINNSANSSKQFYSTIMSSGTLTDKISALTLSVQESPVHNVRNLESLVNLAKKRNRGQAIEVLAALKDLLGAGSLLPSDRRLRSFGAQLGLVALDLKAIKAWSPSKDLPKPLTKIHLTLWAYEDWLKSTYFEILQLLEVWCNDEIEYARLKAVGFVYELLRDKPEQEANLLRLLVNKLGDSDKKIASKTSYYILQVETNHPAMKSLIVSAIESDLLFRPHQSDHAKYYGIITLNQTVLSSREEAVARQLLNIYFALFLTLLKAPVEEGKKNTPKPITRINSKGEVQGGGSAPGKKAQKKAAMEAKSAASVEELREKMVSAVLTGVNRALPYVDKSSDFFDKHLDTLFRVTHSANFNTSVQALMLIQQLCGTDVAASNRFYRTLYESLLDPRILTSSKQALYLNLLYRALRSDVSIKRVKAFAKRLMQITAMHQPSFACAVIYLIRELEGVFPGLAAFIDQPEADENDEEVFKDVSEDDDDRVAHQPLINGETKDKPIGPRYDGRKRDPDHAAAETSCLWELAPLQMHFHPSVSLFAQRLVTHEAMPSKPDLNANTLIHFLDRFVYRNPKKTATGLKGHSIMQPLASSGEGASLLVTVRDKKNKMAMPVNTEGFRSKSADQINADEVFFHKYFNEVGKKADKAKKKREDKKRRKKEEESEAGGEDGGDEDEIWQALVDSRPEIEGPEDDEDDLDMEDFGAEMDEEDGDAERGMRSGSEEEADGKPFDSAEDDEDEGAFDFDDDDAILDSGDELPDGMDDFVGQAAAEENDGEPAGKWKKANKRRKMLRSLPMFASADDYAKMLQDEEEA